MKIHEYQSQRLLADAGVPVPESRVAESIAQAEAAYAALGGTVVVKAQVFAGGRGKAGFVRLCRNADEVRKAAEYMLTHRMVNRQTGPDGVVVHRLLITSAVQIDHEFYVGMTIDRQHRCPVMMVSRQGGVEIEEVATRDPEAIIKERLHPHLGLQPFQVRKLTAALGLTKKELAKAAGRVLNGLADVFLRYDASLVEINPLVRTKTGKLLAIDAKITFDDNALFRHRQIEALRDPDQERPEEVRARRADLSYIALDGNIGCLVNGAGLAMATMDLIKLHGGEPANFLDVGGSVTRDNVVEAFRIILADPKVRGVLVNIFGGIARCDTIAEALVAAAREIGFHVPVVVRLEGTNVEQARQILDEADVPGLVTAGDLTEAAEKVCAAAR